MIDLWTKWRISTAIEKGKPLPPRLLRKIRRDAASRRFYESSLAMAERLRRDAAEIVRQEQDRLRDAAPPRVPEPGRTSPPRHLLRPQRLLGLAAAAVILASVVGAGICWWPSPSPRPVPRPRAVAQEQDIRELMEVVRQIDETVDRVAAREGPRWRERVARSRDALRKPLVREASNMAADTRGILRRLFWIIPSGEDSPGSKPEEDLPSPSSSDRKAPRWWEKTSLACSRSPAEVPL
ncbi:MAG: hypothetical protein ACYSWU_08545 [Planctomycetota bacterium]|jgi:hypothetical protein